MGDCATKPVPTSSETCIGSTCRRWKEFSACLLLWSQKPYKPYTIFTMTVLRGSLET